MLDEWLRNVFVAENEPEHDRVCNVKIVKRLYVQDYTSVRSRGANLLNEISKKRNLANFATNRLQNSLFCQLLNYSAYLIHKDCLFVQ